MRFQKSRWNLGPNQRKKVHRRGCHIYGACPCLAFIGFMWLCSAWTRGARRVHFAARVSAVSAVRCRLLRVWCLRSASDVSAPRPAFDGNAHCWTLATNHHIGTLPLQSAKNLPSKGRARHARRRMKQLMRTIPDLPADVLEQCSPRQLSFAVRRCRGGTQSMLQVVAETHAAESTSQDFSPLSNLKGSSSASPAEK